MLFLWIVCAVLSVVAVVQSVDLVYGWQKRSSAERVCGVTSAVGLLMCTFGVAALSLVVTAGGVALHVLSDSAAAGARGQRVGQQAVAELRSRYDAGGPSDQ